MATSDSLSNAASEDGYRHDPFGPPLPPSGHREGPAADAFALHGIPCTRRALFDHRPAEFAAPIGRIGARFGADDITLVQIARRFVPVSFDPPGELVPGAAKPLEGPR